MNKNQGIWVRPRKRSRLRKWVCNLIGHNVDPLDLLFADIKLNAINSQKVEIKCKRCGTEWSTHE